MKKLNSFILVSTIGLILVGTSQAADEALIAPASTAIDSMQADGAVLNVAPAKVAKASQLIGMDVKNKLDESLGRVEDLAIDPGTGKIAYVAVSVGDFLGMGGRLIAVPMEALTLQTEQKNLLLDTDRTTLQSAPEISKASWPELADGSWLSAASSTAALDTPRSMAGAATTEAVPASAMQLEITNPMPHSMNIVADWGDGEKSLGSVAANSSKSFDVNSPAGTEIKLTASDDAKSHSPTGIIKVEPGTPASWTIQ